MSTIAGDTMQRSFRLATRRGRFAIHTTMALIVIVLFTLTSALEALSGDQSLSAIEAASSIVLAHDIYSNLRDRDVVADRIVGQLRLRCCQMVITIYRRLTKLFPPTWQHHRLIIASTVVPIIHG